LGSNHDDSNLTDEVDNRLDDFFGDDVDQEENFGKKAAVEVNKQLDTFFDEDDDGGSGPLLSETMPEPPPAPVEKKVKKPAPPPKPFFDTDNSPLKELKSVVLSLEWEISDQVMQRLSEEIASLEKTCKNDKIVVAFLQLLSSLGKYIQKKQAEAHPDSISLLNSVYESLEEVMLSDALADYYDLFQCNMRRKYGETVHDHFL